MLLFSHFLLLLCLQSQRLFIFAEEEAPSEKYGQELLLCRKCGADVVDTHYLFTKQSPGAAKTQKQKLFGKQNVTVQSLVNPFGIKFDIVTVEKARCEHIGPRQSAESWFPGYTWRICTCPHCGQHLGWTFESELDEEISKELKSFHGIILSNVLGENFTDSLIMMPMTYKM